LVLYGFDTKHVFLVIFILLLRQRRDFKPVLIILLLYSIEVKEHDDVPRFIKQNILSDIILVILRRDDDEANNANTD
jgi:hypothetical protein